MKIKTLYVRFYKSFNYDYLRKSHPKAVPDEWDLLSESGLFYPFVRVPMELGITTVVGANESGKSQLLGAIKCLLTGDDIERRDFCRYSQFFTVGGEMKKPEFGGEFTDLSEEQVAAVRSIASGSASLRKGMATKAPVWSQTRAAITTNLSVQPLAPSLPKQPSSATAT